MAKNLWGEFPRPSEERTPYDILREQAALVEQNTSGVLRGKTRRATDDFVDDAFFVTLSVVAPALNNYTYDIVTVRHGIVPYPAKIELHGKPKDESYDSSRILMLSIPGEVKNTEELETALERILQMKRTREVISQLLAMSGQK